MTRFSYSDVTIVRKGDRDKKAYRPKKNFGSVLRKALLLKA